MGNAMAEKVTRPSFTSVYMTLATALARRSSCQRLAVGCAIVSEDNTQVLAVGYNGNAAGLANHCDSDQAGACGCLHAEENAVIHCGAPREQPKVVICTHLPCPACAKRIINLGGVRRVVYGFDYRIRTGAELLARVGIVVHAFTDDVNTTINIKQDFKANDPESVAVACADILTTSKAFR